VQRALGFRAYGSENYVGGKFVRVHAMKGRGITEDWLHIFFNILSIWRLVALRIDEFNLEKLVPSTHGMVGWASAEAGFDTVEKINIFRPCQKHNQNSAALPQRPVWILWGR